MRRLFTLLLSLTATATLCLAQDDGNNGGTQDTPASVTITLPTLPTEAISATAVTITGSMTGMTDANIASLRTLCSGVTTFHMRDCTDVTTEKATALFANNTTVQNVILPASFATTTVTASTTPIPAGIYAGCTSLNAMAAAAVQTKTVEKVTKTSVAITYDDQDDTKPVSYTTTTTTFTRTTIGNGTPVITERQEGQPQTTTITYDDNGQSTAPTGDLPSAGTTETVTETTTTSIVNEFTAYVHTPGTLFTTVATPEAIPTLWTSDYNHITAREITATGSLGELDVHKTTGSTNMIGQDIVRLDLGGATLAAHGDVNNHQGHFILDKKMVWASLPDGITKFSGNDVNDDDQLQYISLPASLTTISDNAFEKALDLAEVEFRPTPEGVDAVDLTIGKEAFKNTNLPGVTLPARLTTMGEGAFLDCKSLASVEFEQGSQLSAIPKNAFNDTRITSISIPASVTSIGENAFDNCLSLADVTYEEDSELTAIGNNAFKHCPLTHIDLPEGLLTIGSSAFVGEGNGTIQLIIIPSTVTSIGGSAFQNQWIKDIYFLGKRCPSVGSQAFMNNATFGSGNMLSDDVRVLDKNGNYYTDASGKYQNPKNVQIDSSNPYNQYNSGNDPTETTIKKAMAAMETNGDKLVGSHDLYSYYDATNPNNSRYTAVLHLNPDLLLDENSEELAKFTDPSRHYSMIDAYVGESQRWPTEVELKYAHNIGMGTTVQEGDNWVWSRRNQDGTKFTVHDGEMSLHEFSLVTFDAPSGSQKTEWEFPSLKGGLWWTLCVPFNMKKSDVEDTFGEGTEVCEFNRVERSHTTTGTHTLRLCFTHEKCQFDRDGREGDKTDVSDDATVIHAFKPYMIHPTRDNTSAQVTAFKFKAPRIETGSVIPVNVTATGDGRKYTFIGNMSGTEMYTKSDGTQGSRQRRMPQYCYYLAKKTVNDTEVHGMAFNNSTTRKFKPYCAIVVQKQPSEATDDFQTFFGGAASSAKVMFTSPFGWDSDETAPTAVERVEIVCGSEAVYTLSGQRLTSQPTQPGIYIVGGKKTVVR